MGAADTAKLIASLDLDSKKFVAGTKAALGSLGKLETSIGRIGGMAKQGAANAGRNIALIGAAAAVGIGAAVKSGISSLAELEDAITSVNGAIETVGLTGQISGAQVADWANDIEHDIGAAFDDKAILAAAENLIRYGKVVPANLRPAMEVMTDLAAKTGDVESASTLLGKVLADPAKAAGKLSKQGIILTKAQQKQIKAMVEAGDTAGAQALILDELAKSTKGAAEASQGPYRRSLSVLADVAEDARKALGEGFLPVIQKVSDILSNELGKPGTMTAIREFGQGLADGLDDLVDIARNLPWQQIGDSLKIAGAGAKAVLGAFSALPPWVQTAVLTGWGLNKLTGGVLGGIVGELGKGLIKGVLGMNAGVVNINAGIVNGGGVPGAGGKGKPSIPPIAVAGPLALAALPFVLSGDTVPTTDKNAQGKAEDIRRAIDALKRRGENEPVGDGSGRTNGDIIAKLEAQLGATSKVLTMATRSKDDTIAATNKVKIAAAETARETARGSGIVSRATSSGASQVASAVRNNRPIITTNVKVTVTAAGVSKSVTEQARYGPGNGSQGGGSGHAKGTGPLP